MALLVALLLPLLLGMAALAVDLTNLSTAKAELQAAADATALAGAGCLRRRAECGNLSRATPDWIGADLTVSGFISQNKTQGDPLQRASVTSGYWNVSGTPSGLRSTTISPGALDLPAVQVTVSRRLDENGGLIPSILAGFLGFPASALSATATAALSSPGLAGVGSVFPLAIAQCMYDRYWDTTTGQPKLATAITVPGFDLPQTVGEAYRFKITSRYKAGGCESGQWSSLTLNSNDAATLRTLMDQGNTSSIPVGGSVWIQTGSMTTLYGELNACSAAGNRKCEYVMLPVVANISASALATVLGFACVRLLSATGGSDKYAVAQMSADTQKCRALNSGGVGPNFGIILPPRLVS